MTHEESLPRDVDALIALITKERLERAAKDKANVDLLAKVAALEHRVHVLSRWAFEPRSEKRVIEPLPAGPQTLFTFMLPREEAQRLADQTGAQGSVVLEVPRAPRKRALSRDTNSRAVRGRHLSRTCWV